MMKRYYAAELVRGPVKGTAELRLTIAGKVSRHVGGIAVCDDDLSDEDVLAWLIDEVIRNYKKGVSDG